MFDAIKNVVLCIFAFQIFKELVNDDGMTMLTASALLLSFTALLSAAKHLERWNDQRQGYVNFRR